MDASVLQAAQRVVNWHLQHTVLPSPPAQPGDRAGDDDDSGHAEGSHAEADDGTPAAARA